MSKLRKTEHSGAKNGGGHWGTREEAKLLSKKLRRVQDKTLSSSTSDLVISKDKPW